MARIVLGFLLAAAALWLLVMMSNIPPFFNRSWQLQRLSFRRTLEEMDEEFSELLADYRKKKEVKDRPPQSNLKENKHA